MNDGPLARRDGLVVKTVGDEVLVYDLERARAHSLDGLAAAIWRRCDGHRPVAALAAAVRAETGVPVTAAAVEYGLAALGRARLLAGERPALGPTRRQVLAKIGTAAAIPLVLSITAPTAAQAQSLPPLSACATPGQICGPNLPCGAGCSCLPGPAGVCLPTPG
jgi:Coenzyme PQQ synthesis protein D (PqqD)